MLRSCHTIQFVESIKIRKMLNHNLNFCFDLLSSEWMVSCVFKLDNYRAKVRSSGYRTWLTIGRSWVRISSNTRWKWYQIHARIHSCTKSWFIQLKRKKIQVAKWGTPKKYFKKTKQLQKQLSNTDCSNFVIIRQNFTKKAVQMRYKYCKLQKKPGLNHTKTLLTDYHY